MRVFISSRSFKLAHCFNVAENLTMQGELRKRADWADRWDPWTNPLGTTTCAWFPMSPDTLSGVLEYDNIRLDDFDVDFLPVRSSEKG